MARKQAKTKPAASRPAVKLEKDPLAYEMCADWRSGPWTGGRAGRCEGLLLEELQRRGPRKRSGNKTMKKNVSQ